MTETRQAQTAHGFAKLTAVVTDGGLWRRCRAGEQAHGVISRVTGLDTFTVATAGEIDGLVALTAGALYGVGPTGDLIVNGTPLVGKATSTTSLLVNTPSFAGGASDTSNTSTLYQIQTDLTTLTAVVASNNLANLAVDATQQTQIDALTVSMSSLTNIRAQSRAYAWSVAS
jgi:hypothetical protein